MQTKQFFQVPVRYLNKKLLFLELGEIATPDFNYLHLYNLMLGVRDSFPVYTVTGSNNFRMKHLIYARVHIYILSKMFQTLCI